MTPLLISGHHSPPTRQVYCLFRTSACRFQFLNSEHLSQGYRRVCFKTLSVISFTRDGAKKTRLRSYLFLGLAFWDCYLLRKSIFELCGLKVTQVCEGDNDVVCETVFRIINNNQWWCWSVVQSDNVLSCQLLHTDHWSLDGPNTHYISHDYPHHVTPRRGNIYRPVYIINRAVKEILRKFAKYLEKALTFTLKVCS